MRLALALVLPLVLAGCASEGGSFGLQRDAAPLEPYFHEYREVVSGEHAKRFTIPVDAPARLLNVTISLDTRTNGLPLPGAAPARLQVLLLDPSGAPQGEARLDLLHPEASLLVADASPGSHVLEVRGLGASQDLDGSAYGAGYRVVIEVVYG